MYYSVCYRQTSLSSYKSIKWHNVVAHAFHNTFRLARSGEACACAKVSLRISGNDLTEQACPTRSKKESSIHGIGLIQCQLMVVFSMACLNFRL
jgi:hypothetical protein